MPTDAVITIGADLSDFKEAMSGIADTVRKTGSDLGKSLNIKGFQSLGGIARDIKSGFGSLVEITRSFAKSFGGGVKIAVSAISEDLGPAIAKSREQFLGLAADVVNGTKTWQDAFREAGGVLAVNMEKTFARVAKAAAGGSKLIRRAITSGLTFGVSIAVEAVIALAEKLGIIEGIFNLIKKSIAFVVEQLKRLASILDTPIRKLKELGGLYARFFGGGGTTTDAARRAQVRNQARKERQRALGEASSALGDGLGGGVAATVQFASAASIERGNDIAAEQLVELKTIVVELQTLNEQVATGASFG